MQASIPREEKITWMTLHQPSTGKKVKEALCYQCALRMSILFRFTAPPSLNQYLDSAEYKAQGPEPESEPVKDEHHHARFTIVHETPASVLRYLDNKRPEASTEALMEATAAAPLSVTEGGTAAKGNSCVDGMYGGEHAPRHDVTWLCSGCLGLYQFMDLVHAPMVAADVRRSRFYDSTAISVNVNVNRSFTFAWLATATRYYDREGTMTERPKGTAVIPEEMCNFKEFYMSDLRFRVLQYLLRPHAEVVATAIDSKLTPGIATYLRLVEQQNSADTNESGEPASKQPRTEKEGSSSSNWPPTPQKLAYSADSDKLVCEVYCRHHPTEQLLVQQCVPQQYCSNKVGNVLTYSVIYEYATPFLTSIGWASPSERDMRTEKREAATLSCGIAHSNIFLMGNYRKMMRNLSQSPWFTNGARIGSFSLQEVIANPMLPFFFPEGVTPRAGAEVTGERKQAESAVDATVGGAGAENLTTASSSSSWPEKKKSVNPAATAFEQVFGFGCYKFHSAGREDVDVRMLGTGRPFVMEIINPTREQFGDADIRRMETSINESHNGSVEVFHMRFTDPNITVRLARHSECKIKRYRCVVWSSRSITDPANDEHVRRVNETVDLRINQKTPLRVLHRRSLHARPRTIHSMKLTPLNAHWFILEVETQAGTYVKEFVHGDMGRTTPNLGVLLNARTDIIQLDVVGMAVQDLDNPGMKI